MKIELINENQIRCTLTKEDLANRQLKISELAYGTDKAKMLFREMMQQAAADYGFVVEDIPLMIEAIPLSGECIILNITKVSDPEELDTRFSRFTPFEADEDVDEVMSDMDNIRHTSDTTEEMLDALKRFYDRIAPPKNIRSDKLSLFETHGPVAITNFSDMDSLTKLAKNFDGRYRGRNSLYRASGSDHYTLIMYRNPHSDEEFNRFCFMLPEYGTPQLSIDGSDAHIAEHYDCILENNALQVLAQI